MQKFGLFSKRYHFCHTMPNEIIHLRIANSLYDIINKISHESGLSKQDVVRQMIISQLETKYGDNLMMNINHVKNQIKNEYETNQTTASNPEK